ncbi:MAG: RidA family protein [Cytophagaceae bacterium]|nr:RidA family protein [Cytophagaceae bacterium]
MSLKTIVNSPKAPAPIGPYSQAVQAGGLLFVSGQIALQAETGQLVQTSIEEETHQVMKNLQAILNAAGLGFDQVVKCSIFVTDLSNFAAINSVYGTYFASQPPARETVEVSALPKGAKVEISCMALAQL